LKSSCLVTFQDMFLGTSGLTFKWASWSQHFCTNELCLPKIHLSLYKTLLILWSRWV
jgi:hypothetical protein